MALPRLIFVTGKGGTGKSTVAAALAIALARHRPTLLADLDLRLSAARILGAEINETGITRVSDTLEIASFSPRHELEHFIERIVPMRAISRRMLRSHTFGYVTAALPGLEAFLMLERLRIIAGDALLEDSFAVIDGPATGNAIELLSVARGVERLAPTGTLNRLARQVEEFLVDPGRFGVVITLVPEAMAIREALETATALKEMIGAHRVAAALNCVAEPLFTAGERKKIGSLDGHARLADLRSQNAEAAADARRELERAGIEVVELPMLFRAALAHDDLARLASDLEGALIDQ